MKTILVAALAWLLLLQPARGGGKVNEGRKLPPFPLDQNWVDESNAAGRPSWKKLPHKDKEEPGAELTFPALKAGESFNLHRVVREGGWPKNSHWAWFQVRADRPATILLRFNERPAGNDRKTEFEAHFLSLEVGTEWRSFDLDIRLCKLLFTNKGANGKLDLERITGVGFEPTATDRPLRLEVRGLWVLGRKEEPPDKDKK
jgi:hypothetical protein